MAFGDERQSKQPQAERVVPNSADHGVPGKRTRTMSLPPSGQSSGVVQRKAAPDAAPQEGGDQTSGQDNWSAMADSALRGTAMPASSPVQASNDAGAGVAPPEAPPITRVTNRISDPPYGWTSSYDVQVTESEVRVNIKVKLVPQAGVTEANVEDVKSRARTAFLDKFDNKFVFTDGTTEFAVRTDVQFVDSGEHVSVRLHPGNSRSNLSNWSVERPAETYAHELGHQLGLADEYVDAGATNRARADSPGVHTDHSIMGDIHNEGRAAAEVKQRHGQVIAGHINTATGRSFTVRRR